MEYLKLLLLAVGLLGIAFLGFALQILIKKNGKFPETSISKNKALREKGITCVKHDEYKCSGHGGQGGCCGHS
jgi:hypothetical protein